MNIIQCTVNNVSLLANFNHQLIEDEKSDNKMSVQELEERMRGFLEGDYNAYFFESGGKIVGYALVQKTSTPFYLRHFFIDRRFRRRHYGREAIAALLKHLEVDRVDLEVLPWNEVGIQFWEHVGFRERVRYMRWEKEQNEL